MFFPCRPFNDLSKSNLVNLNWLHLLQIIPKPDTLTALLDKLDWDYHWWVWANIHFITMDQNSYHYQYYSPADFFYFFLFIFIFLQFFKVTKDKNFCLVKFRKKMKEIWYSLCSLIFDWTKKMCNLQNLSTSVCVGLPACLPACLPVCLVIQNFFR